MSGNSEIAIPTPIVGPGFVIITNGYRGVQPIFAIKPGATGDITLKKDETKNDVHRLEHEPRRPLHPDAGHLRRPALRAAEQRRARRLQRRDRRARLPGAARRHRRLVQRVAGRGRRQDLSARARTATSSSSRPGRPTSCSRRTPIGEVIMATPAVSDGLIIFRGLKNVYAIGQPKS